MKKLFIIIGLVFFQSSFAKDIYTYSIGNEIFIFKKVDHLLVSRSCENKKCKAYQSGLTYKSHKLTAAELSGGKNPLSVACKLKLKGKVIIAKDLKGNNQSLCGFSDNSYLVLR
jgi:hypothetical protein